MEQEDLMPGRFQTLSWRPGALAKPLDELFGYVTSEAERAVDWYHRKRTPMQWGGRLLRFGAILATAAAGVMPLLAEIFERDGEPAIDPLWGAFALALAGILVLLDRFWGCTSAWVRYTLALQELSEALDAFRIDWEGSKVLWAGDDPDPEQARAMIDQCKAFLRRVRSVVRKETDAWAAEFQSVLEQIDAVTKSGEETGRCEMGSGVTRREGDL
jgi:hypothetical protein